MQSNSCQFRYVLSISFADREIDTPDVEPVVVNGPPDTLAQLHQVTDSRLIWSTPYICALFLMYMYRLYPG